MNYSLGIPVPPDFAARVERFRLRHAAWELRPMRSAPHVSIKGPGGLSEAPLVLGMIEELARRTSPFRVFLSDPAVFVEEPVLYLPLTSDGWWGLHRTLVDTIAARTGAEKHPLEVAGWIPHMTVLRPRPDLVHEPVPLFDAVMDELSPFPDLTADRLRMYRQVRANARWEQLQDFQLQG
ncbi:MAG: 2'-5' RNA ligase family protein [Acidobacteriota bacterium]|nr:2'-5' RNA ligase family protein [Acidobacteriota bacterium]